MKSVKMKRGIKMFGFLLNRQKYKYLPAIDYCGLSIKEKLKYHKYQKEIAEVLPYEYSLSTAIYMVFSNLLFKKNTDSKFTVPYYHEREPKNDNSQMQFFRINWERSNGDTLKFIFNDGNIPCVQIKSESNSHDSRVAFIIGLDNVIQWEDTSDREEVLVAISEIFNECDRIRK